MNFSKVFLFSVGIGTIGVGCSGGEIDIGNNRRQGADVRVDVMIGNVCMSDAEFVADYEGITWDEAHLDTDSVHCASKLCLTHYFQGRVSCPYGQTEEDLSLPPDDPRRCRVPRSGSSDEILAVQVPVPPSFADRQGADASYCTCECGGPNPECACPTGYTCQEVFEDLAITSIGALCIKDTPFDQVNRPTLQCSLGASPGDPGYCGHQGYNP